MCAFLLLCTCTRCVCVRVVIVYAGDWCARLGSTRHALNFLFPQKTREIKYQIICTCIESMSHKRAQIVSWNDWDQTMVAPKITSSATSRFVDCLQLKRIICFSRRSLRHYITHTLLVRMRRQPTRKPYRQQSREHPTLFTIKAEQPNEIIEEKRWVIWLFSMQWMLCARGVCESIEFLISMPALQFLSVCACGFLAYFGNWFTSIVRRRANL